MRFTGDCTFNGPFTATKSTQEWWWFGDGVKVVFNGPFSGFGLLMGGDRGGTPTVTWTGPVSSLGTHYWWKGTVNHYTPIAFATSSILDNLRVRGGGTYNLYCADVFGDASSAARLMWNDNDATTRTTVFNVASNDQHFAYFHQGDYSAGTRFTSQTEGVSVHLASGTGYSGAPAKQKFNGVFTGTVGLSVEGPLPLVLGGMNSSSGRLSLSNGAKVSFASSGNWVGSVSFVGTGASDAQLTVDGDRTVSDIYTNGVRLAAGTYGATSEGGATVLPFLAGTGRLTVYPTLTTLEISGDYEVAAAGEAYNGIRISGPARITGGVITLAEAAAISSTANAVFDCPLAVNGISLEIAPAAGVTNVFNGVISGGKTPIEIKGGDITARVEFCGDNTFDGKLTVTRGDFHAFGNGALGSSVGATRFCGTGVANQYIDNRITFHSTTNAEPLELAQGFGSAWWNGNNIFFDGGCTFNGNFASAKTGWAEFGWIFLPGCSVEFNGTWTGFGNLVGHNISCGWDSGTRTITFNGPVVGVPIVYFAGADYAYSASLGSNEVRLRWGTHRFNVPDVFGTGKSLIFESNGTYNHILSADQHFSAFAAPQNTTNAHVRSENGSILALTGAGTSSLFNGTFEGNVNLTLGTGCSLTLTGASTTTGTLTIGYGAGVSCTATATWKGALAFLDNGTDHGVYAAPAGKRTSVPSATVNGTALPPGLYGAGIGEAQYRKYFTGTGVVRVKGGGLILLVKYRGARPVRAVTAPRGEGASGTVLAEERL